MPNIQHDSTLKKRIIVNFSGKITELSNVLGPILSPFLCDIDIIRFMVTSKKKVYEVLNDGSKILLTTSNYNIDYANGQEPIPQAISTPSETYQEHISEEIDSVSGIHRELRYYNGKFEFYNDTAQQWQTVVTDGGLSSDVSSQSTQFAIGGLEQGTILTGMTFDKIFERMFIQKQKPSIVLTTNPTVGILEVGTAIPSISLSAQLTKGENVISWVKFYRDNNVINTPSVVAQSVVTYPFSYGSSFSSSTTFKFSANDGENTYSQEAKFIFAQPVYVGNMIETDQVIASIIAANGTKLLYDFSTLTQIVTPITTNTEKVFIAYPATLPDLKSIIDENGINILNAFDTSVVSMHLANNTDVNYKVYVLHNTCTVDNFELTFNLN